MDRDTHPQPLGQIPLLSASFQRHKMARTPRFYHYIRRGLDHHQFQAHDVRSSLGDHPLLQSSMVDICLGLENR